MRNYPLRPRNLWIVMIIGGFLSGASWSAGRAFVEGNEMVLFAGRWTYLGHSVVRAVFLALLVLDAVAIRVSIKMVRNNRRLMLARQQ